MADRRYKLLNQGLPGNVNFKTSTLVDDDRIAWSTTEQKWVKAAAPAVGGGGIINLGKWVYETATTAPPSDMSVRFNNADPSLATEAYVDINNTEGGDLSALLNAVAINSFFYMQSPADATKSVLFRVTSKVDNTAYFTFGMADITVGTTALVAADELSVIVNISQALPTGATDRSSIRWNDTTKSWVENANLRQENDELRLIADTDNPFFSAYATDGTTRLGFLQFREADSFRLKGEVASQSLVLEGRNAGAATTTLATFNPDGATSLYDTGVKTFGTRGQGARVLGTESIFEFYDGTETTRQSYIWNDVSASVLYFASEMHGASVLLRGEDTGGTARALFTGDPDGATELSYTGIKVFATRADGIGVYDTNGNDPLIRFFDNSGGTALGRVQMLNTALTLWNETNSGLVRLRGRDSGGTDRYLLNLDPDHSTGYAGNGLKAIAHVQMPASFGKSPTLWWENQSSGDTGDMDQDSGGIHLTANGMNTTNHHTPGILFGSTDSAFTTVDPKTLAGICGEATQTYSADTHGGMTLAFYATPNNPGTAPTLTKLGEMAATGMILGVPTGSFKGAGTLNAKAVYDDNVLLTCMPVEDALGVSQGREEWDEIFPAGRNTSVDQYEQDQIEGFDGTADGWRALMEAKGSVPGLPNKAEIKRLWADNGDHPDKFGHTANNKMSLSDISNRQWLALDYMAVALRDALNRIDDLEERLTRSARA